jgi:hypothetical protein
MNTKNGELVNVGGKLIVIANHETQPLTETKSKLGRPVDPNSERQIRLQKIEEKRQKGEEIKRGRPVIEGSERQQYLQNLTLKKEAGLEIKRGRPKLIWIELNGKMVKVQEGTIID